MGGSIIPQLVSAAQISIGSRQRQFLFASQMGWFFEFSAAIWETKTQWKSNASTKKIQIQRKSLPPGRSITVTFGPEMPSTNGTARADEREKKCTEKKQPAEVKRERQETPSGARKVRAPQKQEMKQRDLDVVPTARLAINTSVLLRIQVVSSGPNLSSQMAARDQRLTMVVQQHAMKVPMRYQIIRTTHRNTARSQGATTQSPVVPIRSDSYKASDKNGPGELNFICTFFDLFYFELNV